MRQVKPAGNKKKANGIGVGAAPYLRLPLLRLLLREPRLHLQQSILASGLTPHAHDTQNLLVVRNFASLSARRPYHVHKQVGGMLAPATQLGLDAQREAETYLGRLSIPFYRRNNVHHF